jgi:RimJ/RimL family protein N-acetyltransferase
MDVDYEKGEGEPGIFIWDDEYLNSDYSFRAVLCLYDFCFETLKLKTLIAHILQNNKRAIGFNTLFGMKRSENQENIENQEYRLDYKTYIQKKDRIIKYLF